MSDVDETAPPVNLEGFTRGLIKDLDDLRSGKITNSDARVRAQLAREVLRSCHIQLQGMRYFSESAREAAALPAAEPAE